MSAKLIGIILIISGVIMMLYTGFNYVTTETLVDLGPVSIESEKNNFMTLSPILGAILLAAGLILLFLQRKTVNT